MKLKKRQADPFFLYSRYSILAIFTDPAIKARIFAFPRFELPRERERDLSISRESFREELFFLGSTAFFARACV